MRSVAALALVVPFVVGFAAAPSTATAQGDVEFTFADPEIVESSGLAVVDGLVITVNDSGDTGRVFAVDPETGQTVGVTTWSPEPRDVEALAPAGRGQVWVADIGDNLEVRETVEVLRVPVGPGEHVVEPERFELAYPDGPHDAETLIAAPDGRLLVVTKGIFGGSVYRSPRRLTDGVNRLTRLDTDGAVLPIATDGALLPDRRHVVVRNYGSAAFYTYPDFREVGSFALPAQPQGEGIAVDPRGRMLVSTEGKYTAVLRVRVPEDLMAALAPTPSETPSGSPGLAGPGNAGSGDASDDPGASDSASWTWFAGGAALALVLAGVGARLAGRWPGRR
ncbi:hypothetical protein [Nocardioides sp. R-C-SC26]|uniref:hypothetical protein n=1 Tax=Nocardioides sp. R-C-SC26 TaxID=2870414 RepID=UPI001E642529|nr:hypothetical protein [Nocardioides sp. R-C-SC26]